ncbi:AbrB/MazE/SpoVT family DNA-binding domain-containing protein [Mesorhizobium argentiipisi]|uniref:AbrB/MazE/SpoVT family DNA-binding domain-containing protein n=1 Tax=Mesorhizobium argentiipisi TaxID=3015175 RepID=A0ABU8KJP3_9HYPH
MLDSLNLQVGDELQIVETDDGVILRPIRHDNYKRQMNAARDVWTNTKLGYSGWQVGLAASSRPCPRA